MHDEKTVQRFIELRASDWTYARLTTGFTIPKQVFGKEKVKKR
jgi:hypothetical protein